jgi:hypothetical protein
VFLHNRKIVLEADRSDGHMLKHDSCEVLCEAERGAGHLTAGGRYRP